MHIGALENGSFDGSSFSLLGLKNLKPMTLVDKCSRPSLVCIHVTPLARNLL